VFWRANIDDATTAVFKDGYVEFLNANGNKVYPLEDSCEVKGRWLENGALNLVDDESSTILWHSRKGFGLNETVYIPSTQPSAIIGPDGSRVTLEDDLMLSDKSGKVLWRANISGADAYSWNADGKFVVKDCQGKTIWTGSSKAFNFPNKDGTVLLSNKGRTIWSAKDGLPDCSSEADFE
jgi:hypothetical protein